MPALNVKGGPEFASVEGPGAAGDVPASRLLSESPDFLAACPDILDDPPDLTFDLAC